MSEKKEWHAIGDNKSLTVNLAISGPEQQGDECQLDSPDAIRNFLSKNPVLQQELFDITTVYFSNLRNSNGGISEWMSPRAIYENIAKGVINSEDLTKIVWDFILYGSSEIDVEKFSEAGIGNDSLADALVGFLATYFSSTKMLRINGSSIKNEAFHEERAAYFQPLRDSMFELATSSRDAIRTQLTT